VITSHWDTVAVFQHKISFF